MIRRVHVVVVVAALLAFASSALAAPGYSLRWINCAGEGTGTDNRTFACNSNAGTNLLVISFELPADLAQVSGNEVVLDVLSQSATLPAWWDFKNAGSCRANSLACDVTFDVNNVVCRDWAQGAAAGVVGSYTMIDSVDPALDARHRRIKVAVTVPPDALQDLVAHTEYFACNLAIDDQKTVGTGSCGGCSEPMCVVLNSVFVQTPVLANNIFIGNASSAGSNIVTWQALGQDCQAVPTKNRTWGQLKSLYR